MKLPRLVIYLGALALVALVIVVFGAWLLPRLIDSQFIRDKIGSQFAIGSHGSLSFGKITILWLPRPSVVVENAKIAVGDQTQASIGMVKIYPSVFYLLIGQWIPRQALLHQVQLRMRVPERSAKPINLEELEKQIHAALVDLTSQLPAERIDLSEGSAEISIGDHRALILENVAAQTITSNAELRFHFRARSNLFAGLKIEGRTSPQNLASQLDIGVQRLKVNETFALLALPISNYLQSGETSFDVRMVATGLRQLKASIDGSIGPLVLARHGGTTTVEAKRLKGEITYQGGAFQVDLEQLDLGAPRLQASGQLKILADSFIASVKVRDGDIAQMSELALRLADDAAGVKSMLRFAPAGTISEMNFRSAARSFAELASSENIDVAGTVRNGKIVIPGPDLEFTNVSASVRLTHNIVEGKNITANLGTAKGSNGELRLGLTGKTAPFHLDMRVNSGAPELQSVLLKVVADETFRRELLNVQNLEGEISGRLILGETLGAIAPVVEVSKADISATYAPVPFPITIRGGRFNYDRGITRFESAQASVGRSRFAGLAVTWHHDESRQIKVDSGRVLLDLQQTDTLLRRFKDLREYLAKIQSLRGQIELQKLSLAGAYDEPAGWAWASTGSFSQIEMQHADFPERIYLSRGKFTANHERIAFADSAVSMSDAALITDGTFEYEQGRPSQFEASGTGNVGARMTQWLSHYVELPEAVKLRSPLTIAAGRLGWQAGGEVSFRGEMTVADGARISLDAVKNSKGLALKDFTIDDGGRRARMTLQLSQEHLDLSFSGELNQPTIDKVLTSFPMKGGSLQGDIQVSAALADPLSATARGQLSGSDLRIPLGAEEVWFDKFSLEASGASVLIRSADLRWQNRRLSVAGKVDAEKEDLRLDLDVSADRLELAQLDRLFGGGDEQRDKTVRGVLAFPRLEGTIRLKVDEFVTEQFSLSGVQVQTVLASSLITAAIERGVVCGINTTGRLEVAGREIRLDLQLAAKDAELGPTTICLTNQRSDVKGTYTLSARITGRGDREHLGSALKGDFNFSARDGEFVRADGVDATFDYLNDSGDFNVNFPDLDKQAVAYQMLTVIGKIDGAKVFNNEIVIRASPYTITGQGSFDLQRQQLDLKGLVSVALPAQQVIKRIPIIRIILGGSLVGIPLRISGSWERPNITYMSPADVGGELLNLPLRILGLPLDAIRLFAPGK